MRRFLAGRTEIIGVARDAAAKVIRPNPIDDHAGCERIVRIGDPFRQGGPPAVDISRETRHCQRSVPPRWGPA